MKQRGRKSANAAAVAAARWDSRPVAPDDLSDEEKVLWTDIVATKSADWFDAGSLPLLRELVKLDTDVRLLGSKVESFEPEWLNDKEGLARYEKLISMRDRVQNRMVNIATKLRLTQQARFQPVTAATRSRGRPAAKPWEDAG